MWLTHMSRSIPQQSPPQTRQRALVKAQARLILHHVFQGQCPSFRIDVRLSICYITLDAMVCMSCGHASFVMHSSRKQRFVNNICLLLLLCLMQALKISDAPYKASIVTCSRRHNSCLPPSPKAPTNIDRICIWLASLEICMCRPG